ncbi:MAG: ComF family protein [Planctomycetes bacterium]|nr:ComF family protein [Planctomycetota bacterium]
MKCSLPLDGVSYCSDCRGQKMTFTQCIAAAVYDGIVKDILHKIKFSKKLLYFGAVEQIISGHLPLIRSMKPDVIIPVPFSIVSLIERGFDLPLEIAIKLGRTLKICTDSESIVRRFSRPQRFLTKEERKKNLQNCFVVRDRSAILFKRILVVDDIMSTGSTVNELSRVLLMSGAKEVQVFVVARAATNNL